MSTCRQIQRVFGNKISSTPVEDCVCLKMSLIVDLPDLRIK